MEPITILTALLPALTDGIRGMITKWTGGAGAKPANIQEAIQLMDAEVRRLEVIAKLDSTVGDVDKWVNNVRALQRPVAAGAIILAWIGVMATPGVAESTMAVVSNLASAVIFYLFGDRTYMYFKKGN